MRALLFRYGGIHELEKVFTDRRHKIALYLCNAVIMAVAVIASLLYAKHTRAEQLASRRSDFITTVESMKSVSQNYLDSERGYVTDWGNYITGHNMTLTQAMAFLRSINSNDTRYAHIVDMDTFEAWSSYYPAGEDAIDTYIPFLNNTTDYEVRMYSGMFSVFNGEDAAFNVVGKYMLDECFSTGVSVGTRITLQTDSSPKDYLLLRAMPTDVMKKSWVFPAEYQSAEVGIITRDGDYVVQSPSMKSMNFPEYIRGYNFQDDYNRVKAFQQQLMNTDSGVLHYKNFRGEDCFWYYSSFGNGSTLDILGLVRESELQPTTNVWTIVFVICGSLAVLIILDGGYLMLVNRRLRETARLAREASEAKTQFLSAMSHDIRTPMNAVLGMMSIAQRNAEDPEYVRQCLAKSARAGQQLLTLINDVLDISKIESGKFVLTPSDISLKELFSGLAEILSPQMQEKGLAFTYDIRALPYPYVNADRIRLNQIYMNLMSNAMKYTPSGGEVHMELWEEAVPADPSRTQLVFKVTDNGIGMTQEFQQNMYQSFSRAVSTQVNRTQGSGLGLSIVRQMVDLMHGTITCSSTVGEGTTFVVQLQLPIVSFSSQKDDHSSTGNTDVSGLHLLVAEDNEMNWEIIQILLDECGVTCERAENGRICVEKLRRAPVGTYDGIFMDVQMPVMTGIEATRAIRKLPESQNGTIPIIAMTADAFAEDVQACLNCGMNGHIAKPVDIGKLKEYLQKIKQGKLFSVVSER